MGKSGEKYKSYKKYLRTFKKDWQKQASGAGFHEKNKYTKRDRRKMRTLSEKDVEDLQEID